MKSGVRVLRYFCIVALVASLGAGCGSTTTQHSPPRPHIVFILADDMGFGDVAHQIPHSKIPTPHLDRLAAEGRRFTDAHTTSAVCTPTRYGILTGRYNWRSTLKSGVLWGDSPLLISENRLTVASLLRRSGYSTAVVGKWHLGLGWREKDYAKPLTAGPTTVGFEESFVVPASLDMSPYCYVRNLEVVDAPTEQVEKAAFGRPGWAAPGLRAQQVLGDLAREATRVIEDQPKRNPGKPLFLYFPLTAPHKPVAPSAEFQGKSEMGDYGDFVMEVDWVVGQVMEALERAGIADNTLLIFTADNGASPNAAKAAVAKGHMPNWPYRGGKTTLWEGGHRVPFFARWPARIRPGTVCAETVCTVDLMATCAALVGEPLPDNAGEDSVSLLPALAGEPLTEALRRTTIHHSHKGYFAIRRGPWKLITIQDGGGWGDKLDFGMPQVPIDKSVPMQLYDIERDPGEKQNLYREHPEIVEELLAELTAQINGGRSTPGSPQPNDDDGAWEQLTWMEPGEYTNHQVAR